MRTFILVTFAFLAAAFYEMSGGNDFVPRKAELIAAARQAEAAAAADRAARQAAEAAAQPVQVVSAEQALSVKDEAAPVKVTLRTARPAPEPAPEPAPQTETAVAEATAADGTPPAITLVSLEQSGVLFARPLNQLDAQGPAPTQPGVTLQPARPDIRSVTGSRVNMRTGPGTEYGVMASLVQGDEVEVIADEGLGWVKLRTADGQIGWMADFLLSAPAG